MIEVVMAIVKKDSRVLLVRRAKGEGKLVWQFPGGAVEEGESVNDTALRELKEETGVTAKPLFVIGERVHPYTKKEMAYVALEYVEGGLSVSDPDLDLAEWVEIDRLNDYFTTPLYDKVADYLGITD